MLNVLFIICYHIISKLLSIVVIGNIFMGEIYLYIYIQRNYLNLNELNYFKALKR